MLEFVLLQWQKFASWLVTVFFDMHRGTSAGGRYRSVSKLGLLIDICIATSHWPFVLCFKLGHI